MKKNLLSLILCFLILCLFSTLNAQPGGKFQLRNGDFEAPFVPSPGAGSVGTEPPFWHSFGSCTGSQSGLARDGGQVVRSTDTRNGIGFSCELRARTIMFIATANGNLTTGRINAGSMSAAHVDNHNFTDPANDDFNEPWTSYPDSIRFWAKYTPNSATQWARMSAYIHDDYKFTDPTDPNVTSPNSANHIVAHAVHEWQRGTPATWYQYTVPFDYASYAHLARSPKYIMITFTTNRVPGSGSGSDRLWIDDVEMVYSAWLTDLKVNGITIDGFQKGLLTYGGPKLECEVGECPFPYQPGDFSWTPESNRITNVEITNNPGLLGDADGGYTSILVTAQDYITQVEYRIYYYADRSDDNTIASLHYTMLGDPSIPVPGFVSTITNYNISLTDPEEVRVPQIREEDVILSDATAKIQRIEQPTSVNSTGKVVVQAENLSLKTYNLIFSKVVSSNSKLNWIKVSNVDIPDFHPDTLNYIYEITNCVTAIPAVTYERTSAWANVSYVPATMANRTATIIVTAENNTQTIYTINFVLKNNNANLLGYRVNSTNRNNTFSATNFTDTYSASLTAIFTLSLSTTSGQQVCAGSTVVFPSPVVWFPDTNKINVTAQDGVTKQEYGVIVKNTNCYLKQTSGSNVGLKYRYNGVVRNITVPSSSNNNDVTINVTIPVVGPNEPCELIEADPQAPVVDTIIYTQPVSRAGNSGRVRVVANDGVANKTYIINFTPTLSDDATLSNLTYNGFQVPGFTPTTEFYTLIFPSNVTEMPVIEYTPSFQWLPEENVVYIPALTFSDTTIIEVTSERGTLKRTYRIAYEIVEPEKDAYLSILRYNNILVPNFNPTTFNYDLDIPYSTAPLPPVLSAEASSPLAIVVPTVPLNIPPYTGKMLVFSGDMTVHNIYTVNFNLVKDTIAALADIQIDDVSLEDFNSQIFNYPYELPYTKLGAPVVTATPAYEYAQVVISQIDTVIGTVTIHVTAEDDAYTAVYTVDFTRELSPVIAMETVFYEYDDQMYEYDVTCNETEITIILPVETIGEPFITNIKLADNRADYLIDEQPDAINDLTGIVIVTAEDLTEETYSIIFERTLSESTLLTSISYNGIPVPGFNPEILTYEILLGYNTSEIPYVTAIVAWQNTDVNISQPTNPFGQATIYVTSEDGQNFKTYTIVFQRQGNPHLVDLSYKLDGISYPVTNFSPTTFVYNVTLPIGTTAVPVLEYIVEDNRCTIYEDFQNTPNGTSQVKLVTWNEDDSVTYTVNFTVALSTEAILCDLRVNGVTIPNFHSNTFTYTVPTFPFGTELPEVAAEACHPDAIVEITQIDEFPGIATIVVTAGDMTTNTYTIAFSVHSGDNTYLLEILFNEIPFDLFDKDTYFYEIELLTNQLPVVTAIAEDTTSIVAIEPLEPQMGDTINITVTALNGDVALYQIYFFIDERNNNAYASMIYVDWEPLPGFVRYIPEYTVTLPANYVGEPLVAPELEDPNATFVRNWDYTIPLEPKVKITVTAENEVTEFTYIITFQRGNSVISFDNETEIQVYPNPSSDKIHFVIDEMIQTGKLEIYAMEGKRIGSHNLQGGTNTINIEHLSKGIYFYKIFTDQTMIGTGKFVKN